jgi:hypothetical protein
VLTEALWAHKVSKYSATKVTPFELVFSQEVVLPVEVNLYAQWEQCMTLYRLKNILPS